MTTPALTVADFGGKFAAIRDYVTPAVLATINQSESMKKLIRDYETNKYAAKVQINTKSGVAEYKLPVDTNNLGFASFDVDRLSTVDKFIESVSHELGHADVENPGSTLANARNNAQQEKNTAAYESACHLTEGYAQLATAKVIDELAQNSPSVTWLRFVEYKKYLELRDAAGPKGVRAINLLSHRA